MEQSNKRSFKIAGGIAIVLMVAAIAWGSWNARIKGNFSSDLDQEKLRSEELLSEKLLLEKNLASTDAQLDDLAGKNETLSGQLAEAGNLNILKDGTIGSLQRQLVSNKKTYNELSATNRDLQNKLALLDGQIGQIQEERVATAQERETLRAQVDNLKRELAMARNAYYDQVWVESSRGKNDKLVVKANRTRKLKASVMIPSNLKDVQFQVFDPLGNIISSSPENGITAVKINDAENVVARSSSNSSAQTYKRAEMTFLPKKKLAAGTYRIEVLSENLSVGTVKIRLR